MAAMALKAPASFGFTHPAYFLKRAAERPDIFTYVRAEYFIVVPEGSVSVGGGYNSQTQSNDGWAGAAGTSRGAGQWQLQGNMVALYNNDGGQQNFSAQNIAQGSWKVGQYQICR